MGDLGPVQPLSYFLACPNLQPPLCVRERLGFGSICLPQGARVLPGIVLGEGTQPGCWDSPHCQESHPLCFQIDQPTLGMPSREYYFKEDSHRVSRKP